MRYKIKYTRFLCSDRTLSHDINNGLNDHASDVLKLNQLKH